MLIAYIDESYDVKTRVGYFMSAVLVRETDLAAFWQSLMDCAHGVCPTIERGAELHAVQLFGRSGLYAPLAPEDRIAIFRKGLECVTAHAVGVVVASHVPEPSSVNGVGLRPLLAEWRLGVIRALIPLIEDAARREGEYLLLVCDEEHSTTSKVIDLLHGGRRLVGILGTPIVETAMFARSSESPGIWAADLIAFVERRIDLAYDDDSQVRVGYGSFAPSTGRIVWRQYNCEEHYQSPRCRKPPDGGSRG